MSGINERPVTSLVAFYRSGVFMGRAELRHDGKWHVRCADMKGWHVCDTEQAACNFLTAYGAAVIQTEPEGGWR